LAVRAAGLNGTRPDFLSGEHEIITGMLHLCLANPSSASARIMLFDTLRRLTEVRPQVSAEFRARIQLLQKEFPPPAMACTAIDNLLAEVFSS
jgi:hypothetical protein